MLKKIKIKRKIIARKVILTSPFDMITSFPILAFLSIMQFLPKDNTNKSLVNRVKNLKTKYLQNYGDDQFRTFKNAN